jgi:ribosomal-protein-alanine N-acetyltransferase
MNEHKTKINSIRLEAENLVLRPIEISDRDFIFQQFSDPEVCQYLVDEEPFTKIEEAEELIQFYTVSEPRRQYRWIIVRKSDGKSMGTCGYHKWDIRNNSSEIGYDLAPPFWGKGYMTEALTAALKIGFTNMDLNRIQALIDVRNERSVNLVSKLGFKNEGIIRDKYRFRGEYYDHYCFSLLKKEWNR